MEKDAAGQREDEFKRHRGAQALVALLVVGALGLILIVVFASHSRSAAVFSVATMFAAAALVAGALLGFLFGIPRTSQSKDGQTKTEPKEQTDEEDDQKGEETYASNTNLEQISDWLTKILVGAGLVQLGKVGQLFNSIGDNLGPAFGEGKTGQVFAIATFCLYLLLGFLIGYLWTRLYFAGALREATFAAIARRVDALTKQSARNAKAMALVHRQLNPSNDLPAPSQEELNAALESASGEVREYALLQAQTLRTENWRNQKAKMERTIPIFRGLIYSDKEQEFHTNFGQLGYALKDSRNPNWKDAEAALSEAIKLRGRWQDHSWWLYYEFNRAICRINIDDDKQSRPSPSNTRNQILEDLRAAFTMDKFIEMAQEEPAILNWIRINNASSALPNFEEADQIEGTDLESEEAGEAPGHSPGPAKS
jgi:uncharacterized integral membrane protein